MQPNRGGRRMGCSDGARQGDFGRRHIGLVGCQSPPLDEALGDRMGRSSPPREIRLSATADRGVACRRLKKMVPSYTGEILRRPTVGKSLL